MNNIKYFFIATVLLFSSCATKKVTRDEIYKNQTSLKSSTDSFNTHPQIQIEISEYEKKGFQKRRPKEGSKNKPV